jgi:hypothetical protein
MIAQPFPGDLVEDYYDGGELLTIDASKFIYSNDPEYPIKKCRLLEAPDCKYEYRQNKIDMDAKAPDNVPIIVQRNDIFGYDVAVCIECWSDREARTTPPWRIT